jgi:[ribosomal protein S5]-alanine N-acetyltransferase
MNLIPISENIIESEYVQHNESALSVCLQILKMYEQTKPNSPWLGYLFEQDSRVVGSCAFKSPPKDGCVEIAYFTFPEYEGRGFATEMSNQLLLIAAASDAKVQVFAQTLPVHSASTKILEKLGFTFSAPVIHPEDGLVWEWVKIQ